MGYILLSDKYHFLGEFHEKIKKHLFFTHRMSAACIRSFRLCARRTREWKARVLCVRNTGAAGGTACKL